MKKNKSKNAIKKTIGVVTVGIIGALAICFIMAYKNTGISNNQINLAERNNKNAENLNDAISILDTQNVNIVDGGSYVLSGKYENIIIDTDQEVILNLNGVEIINYNGPAINVINAKSVTIVLSATNKVTAKTTEDLDGAIYSKTNLVFSGTGNIEVKSNYDGIVAKGKLVIKNGTYTIDTDDDGIRGKECVEISDGAFTIKAGGDGIKSTNEGDLESGYVNIKGGTYNITAKSDGIQGVTKVIISEGTFNITSAEGIEANNITINKGTINISATDDGINASKSPNCDIPSVEINGGNITIKMGKGDIDGIDTNGNLYINGGTIDITGNSPFDYDGEAEYKGGTIIVNGEQTKIIKNQFSGGTLVEEP